MRISPFDNQGRRQTSFAAVEVVPVLEQTDEIEIPDEEIRVDVYRSGGPGGQSVNTTDSAVRLTHIPTGLVVSCQNEKSQLQNKASAMVVLKAKLLALKKAEEKAQLDEMRGDVQASWGDQMRNYVLNPYQIVKDLRTGYETGNPSAVFDGDLDDFLEAGIRWRPRSRQGRRELGTGPELSLVPRLTGTGRGHSQAMSELQVVPGEMTSASNQTISAAEGARGHGSSEELTTAGTAIPGADSVGHLSELGTSWDDEVEGWARRRRRRSAARSQQPAATSRAPTAASAACSAGCCPGSSGATDVTGDLRRRHALAARPARPGRRRRQEGHDRAREEPRPARGPGHPGLVGGPGEDRRGRASRLARQPTWSPTSMASARCSGPSTTPRPRSPRSSGW